MPTNGSGGVSPIFPPANYIPGSFSNAGRPQASEGQYDKVNISRTSSGPNQFQKELVSRLVREVRTAHTASDIQQIKTAVQNGSYSPNPNKIAAKLLLEENMCGND